MLTTTRAISLETRVRPRTILLVHDRHALRTVLATELRHLGYRVFEATHDLETLPLDRHCAPDALIVDVDSNLAGGVAVALRLQRLCPTLHVLLLGTDAIPQHLDADYTTCLPKPFSKATFVQHCQNLSQTTAGWTGR